MNPWWLRPPADEPAGDEKPTGPGQGQGPGQETQADDARADRRRESTTGDASQDVPAPAPRKQGGQRPARRRSRKGQTRRTGREGGDIAPAPTSERTGGRRQSRPPSESPGAKKEVVAGKGSRESTGGTAGSNTQTPLEERRLAVICDLENITLGLRQSGAGDFDIELVLQRLLDKGRIDIKRAYADWERHRGGKQSFHKAGMELIDLPPRQPSGRSGAEIRIAVDAMELCYSKQHLDTFVLISGDGDLTPLVFKLKGNDKRVIGLGPLDSSSPVLVESCDEFLFYEDVRRQAQQPPQLGEVEEGQVEVMTMLVEAVQAMMRENQQILWGSVIKQTMQRKHPSFNESHFGYSSFSKLLQEAEAAGVIKLRKDQRSGSYVVTGFARI